jgi:hypothetical protein
VRVRCELGNAARKCHFVFPAPNDPKGPVVCLSLVHRGEGVGWPPTVVCATNALPTVSCSHGASRRGRRLGGEGRQGGNVMQLRLSPSRGRRHQIMKAWVYLGDRVGVRSEATGRAGNDLQVGDAAECYKNAATQYKIVRNCEISLSRGCSTVGAQGARLEICSSERRRCTRSELTVDLRSLERRGAGRRPRSG